MAHRRAVVATNAGGLPDKVKPGVNGWLVEPGDPSALAAAISGAIGEPQRLAAFGQAGRRSSRSEFSWDAAGRATLALYKSFWRNAAVGIRSPGDKQALLLKCSWTPESPQLLLELRRQLGLTGPEIELTFIVTSTGAQLSSVPSNSHWRTASIAALSRSGCTDLTTCTSRTVPSTAIVALSQTLPASLRLAQARRDRSASRP